jgi:hypothetical protein
VSSEQKPDVLAKQMAELDDWVTGKRSHLFSAFIAQFNYLRKFAPAFLECLEFEDSRGTSTPLIHATELLREMNATNKRKLPSTAVRALRSPSTAPTEFVSKTIRPLKGYNEHECKSISLIGQGFSLKG